MKTSRYASTRQKACHHCSNAKAKCDRKLRCTRESTEQHDATMNNAEPHSPISVPDALTPGLERELQTGFYATGSQPGLASPVRTVPSEIIQNPPTIFSPGDKGHIPSEPGSLSFSDLDLLCPINVDGITTRWMNPYIPDPGQKIKYYPDNVMTFIARILKSYTAIATRRNDILPFIHWAQMKEHLSSSPLTTCLSLIRMCQNPLPGSESTASMIIQREMEGIMDLHKSFDHLSLLAAFQAYLIYTMVLFFRLGQTPNNGTGLRQAMINLQELAHASSRHGIVCTADQHRARPRWEEWIVTEAKRRTLYVMYLFDSLLSTQERLPTYLGTELEGLPAPSNKFLWRAESRGDWERRYNVYLAEWIDRGLAIDELWPFPPGLDEPGICKRRERVDRWLEDIDEFGTMLYAVVSCTHGG
ncbi:hypothetical protein N7492_004764 [Penicillium capsulatum]|uniref:Zn(2)-C6 fungal-type domain-containing protein n=1 Tax=Penicillium capsulatum TaxID=69766 RepID=A0A9W9IAZ3_9EURO|nr:hypothetical protein N7492_004764 [Penicillium capsulatum]